MCLISQQALECEMTVTNYCGHIAHGEKPKKKSPGMEKIFIQNEFYIVTVSTVHATEPPKHIE